RRCRELGARGRVAEADGCRGAQANAGAATLRPMRAFTLLLLIPALAASPARAAEHKPNILVVLADQWRAQAFGFAGDPNVTTPNFDHLALEKIRFINAIVVLPVWLPTRAARASPPRPFLDALLFTGL